MTIAIDGRRSAMVRLRLRFVRTSLIAIFVAATVACTAEISAERAGLWVPWPQLTEGECGAPATGDVDNVYVIVRCDEEHIVEAYGSVLLTETADYSSLDGTSCYSVFEERTGIEFADSGLGGTHVYPDSDSWDRGNREMVCLAWAPLEVTKPVSELDFNTDFGDIHPWTQVQSGWCLSASSVLALDPVAVQAVECQPGSALVVAQVPVNDFGTCEQVARTMDKSDPVLIDSQTMQRRGYEKSLCIHWS